MWELVHMPDVSLECSGSHGRGSGHVHDSVDCEGDEMLLPTRPPSQRTRRTDGMLCLTERARGSMRAWFGGDGARLVGARLSLIHI